MYSQSRTNGYNFGESEDAQFKREEHMLVNRTENHQNDVKASPKLQSFNYPYSSTSLDQRIEKGITNGYENVCHSREKGSADSQGDENGLVSDSNQYVVLCEFSSDIYENDGDDFLSDNKHQSWMDNITGGTSRKEYIDNNLYRVRFVIYKIVRNRKLILVFFNWVVESANGQFDLNLFFSFEIYQFGFFSSFLCIGINFGCFQFEIHFRL